MVGTGRKMGGLKVRWVFARGSKVEEGARGPFCGSLTRAVPNARHTICHFLQETQTAPCHIDASKCIFFSSKGSLEMRHSLETHSHFLVDQVSKIW